MKLTQEELDNQTLNPETIQFAVTQIRLNGYIIFESVISKDFIDEVNSAYMELFERLLQDPGQTFGTNHYGMSLPFRSPFNDERLIANPLVVPILEAMLGEDFVSRNLLSNTCMPGSGYQDTHSDLPALYPEERFLMLPPYMIVLNIPLVDFTEENGATEIWPGGTHYMTMPNSEIAKLKANMTSTRAVMPMGSILLRDGRMWHNGTPNNSNAPRPMLAWTYSRPWFGGRGMKQGTGIPQEIYETLPPRSKRIFRLANIGGELDTEFTHRDNSRERRKQGM